MKHIGLFEGIGGFSLAARWMNWQTVAWCEWNPFAQQVLKHHFPEAEGFGDITKTDFTKYANTIDILTGGFPCQPYSQAGKRLGKEDERHLWPEMLRAIREISPCYVVGENVSGLTNWNGGMVFNEVQADLEAEGYEVLPFLLPACGVNAPHRRDRIWIIAYNTNARIKGLRREGENSIYGFETTPYSGSEQLQERTQDRNAKNTKESGARLDDRIERPGNIRYATNSEKANKQRDRLCKECEEKQTGGCNCLENNWHDFPTQPPICSRNDGVPVKLDNITFPKWRSESLKAFGNAIVPQVALQIFRVIAEMEASYTGGGVGANTNTQGDAKLETSSGIA